MNAEDTLSTRVAQVQGEAVRLAKVALPSVLVYVVVLTLGGIYIDQQVDFSGPTILLSIATLVIGFWMATTMLKDGGLAPNGLATGFGTYFGLAFLSSIAIALGFVLLLIPGLVLLIRWLPVYGYGLVDGQGVSDAFGRAWAETDGHFAPLAVAMVGPLILYAIAMGVYILATDELGIVALVPSIIANLAMSIGGVAITAIGIATYSLLDRSNGGLTEVFE